MNINYYKVCKSITKYDIMKLRGEDMKRDFKKEIAEIHPNIEVIEAIKSGADKVLCRCNKDGYEWRTRPYDLVKGHGCHMCNGVPRYTDETFKRKMKEINPMIDILGEYKRAHSKLEWRCKTCLNKHMSKPNSLLSGNGCRICSTKETHDKQRKTTDEFKDEVYSIVGNDYKVMSEYKGTEIKIELKHQKCGYSFDMTPHNFLGGQRCPECNGGVRRKTTKYFNEQVKKATNNEYEFVDQYKGNNKKVKFKHVLCGRTFKTTPDSFLTQKTGCPYCFFMSKGELEVKRILEKHNIKFVQQKTFDDLKHEAKLRFDFYLTDFNYCIEYDGKQHFEPLEHWGGKKEFEKIRIRDSLKNNYCARKNINLLRVHYRTKDIEGLIKENLNV